MKPATVFVIGLVVGVALDLSLDVAAEWRRQERQEREAAEAVRTFEATLAALARAVDRAGFDHEPAMGASPTYSRAVWGFDE